ncbi:PCI domain-containing protein [Cardiosporidium cionae]|uniref:Eukaryotic translation initiation factor 3 subunit M n=1 Tax=Cardiosporidium cionae TaxID=476202 RepID=A0ABQ7JEF7_9APIC|nr:PCI domain-containing protein [Cardiosporidium cionae]|eukprot:KAF8822356.1 PCI domain-containing protein [Cardiosporidium cionae]
MTTFVALSGDVDGMVNIGDWLLLVLRIKKSADETDSYKEKFLAQFAEDPEIREQYIKDHVALFHLLLGEVHAVLSLLDDARTHGEVTMTVTTTESGQALEKEVRKTFAEILKEVEEFFIVLMAMVATRFPSDEAAGVAAGDLVKVLRSSTTHAEMRLKLLKSLYNVFAPSFPYRFPIFVAVLEFAAETSQFHLMLPYIRYLNEWMKDWNLSAPAKRQIFLLLVNQLKKLGKLDEAYPYLKRHIQFFQGEKAQVLAAAATVSAAVALAEDSIKLPDIIYFDSILELDAIKHLRETSYRPLVELLDIFLKGGPQDLRRFHDSHSSTFSKHELNYEDCMGKIRLLALTFLAANVSELNLRDIEQALELNEYDAQELIVKAIGQGLLDAKIDQMNKVLRVRSTMQREFTRNHWELLEQKLRSWTENVKSITSTS